MKSDKNDCCITKAQKTEVLLQPRKRWQRAIQIFIQQVILLDLLYIHSKSTAILDSPALGQNKALISGSRLWLQLKNNILKRFVIKF